MEIILFDKTYHCQYVISEIEQSYILNINNISIYIQHTINGDFSFTIWDCGTSPYRTVVCQKRIKASDLPGITMHVLEPMIKLSVKYNLGLVDSSYAVLI